MLCGPDALVAQARARVGTGRRSTARAHADDPLDDLVAALLLALTVLSWRQAPRHRRDVKRVRDVGATTAQIGTALLLTDEAEPIRYIAPHCASRTSTRRCLPVLTGRYALALRNRSSMTRTPCHVRLPRGRDDDRPIQAAAMKVGDPHGVALWAGVAFDTEDWVSLDLVRDLA